MIEELTAFLRACYDEEERTALDSHNTEPSPGDHKLFILDDNYRHDTIIISGSRVLREVATNRRILNDMIPVLGDLEEIAYSEGQAASDPNHPGEYLSGRDREPTLHLLKLLALPYAGEDGYKTAWALAGAAL